MITMMIGNEDRHGDHDEDDEEHDDERSYREA